MAEKWPRAYRKLIESAANGPAVVSMLQHEVAGIIAVTPLGSKVARASAITALVESGNTFLPHPHIALWVDSYLAEMAVFPHGRHDDQVDQTSMALSRLHSTGLRYGLTEFMQRAQVEGTEEFVLVNVGAKGETVPDPNCCPLCAAVCIARVSSGGYRCGKCAHQWSAPVRRRPGQSRGEAMQDADTTRAV